MKPTMPPPLTPEEVAALREIARQLIVGVNGCDADDDPPLPQCPFCNYRHTPNTECRRVP